MAVADPDRPAASTLPRVALALAVVALVGAVAYILHLQGQLAQPPRSAAAPTRPPVAAAAPAAAPAAPGAPAVAVDEAAVTAVLTAEQQRAMQDTLAAAPGEGRKAWFQVQANNPDTAAVQVALQRVFESAGWTTETVRAPYGLKSGIFLLAADETPPPLVESVNAAFGAAGIDAQYLTGYRAFYVDRKQNNPNWVGPELASDQPFVIAIGSRPTPKPGP
jgi:hypothetical protein